MKTSTEFQRLLDIKGIPLQELGIRDIALEREDALRAVDVLRKSSVLILGGDVYLQRATGIESAYANWHSDPEPNEAVDDYLSRSWTTTENYIRSFPEPSDAKPLFSLVVGA